MNSWKVLKYRLIGVAPVVLHNGRLADPMNYFSREIKKISGKRKKTDADHERLAELEYKGSLYVDDQKRPIVPAEAIQAVLVAGAKKTKEGQVAKAGVFPTKSSLLEYDGPKDPDSLWNSKKFVISCGVKVKQARVIRTRPMFEKWHFDVELNYNPSIVNEQQIYDWLRTAGDQCGMFENRPIWGRFEVQRLSDDNKPMKIKTQVDLVEV